jgi:N-methylhydantoinase A
MASDGSDRSFSIGVDVGGTFTDVVLSDGLSTWRAKAPSTHGAIGDGVLEACRLVAEHAGCPLPQLLPRVERFGFGTTAVTNVIATRSGLKVGLITTAGFEDLVPIARVRRVPRDGWLVPPETLVDRECIRGLDERVDRDGRVLKPLDVAEVHAVARQLVDQGVEAIVVSLLWSFVNPANETAAAAAVAEAYPGLVVVSAAALLPVIREFERTTFAVLNAYTARALDGVDALIESLHAMGLRHAPLLVHSGGGSVSAAQCRRTPAMLAESGPAAGVIGALAVCEAAGVRHAVTCDMGGTSFDMSIMRDRVPTRRNRGDLMGIWTALPRVDIESASAGGGSIGWRDALGFLRVGPRSAGAYPGPACYGRGGVLPTVTDALLVLGYLDPQRFLGGAMQLDTAAAHLACARLGEQLGTDAIRVAWGIREIALTEMARALRAEFARHGFDPREFTLISLGGCGGLFNVDTAAALNLRSVLVPELTSVLSAFGAATADVRRERSISINRMLPVDGGELATLAAGLRAEVDADLAADGVPTEDREIRIELDLRFARQQWELPMPIDAGLSAAAQLQIGECFQEEYARRFGRGAIVLRAPKEVATLRVIGTGRTVRALLRPLARSAQTITGAARTRSVVVSRDGVMVREDIPVFDMDGLSPGATFVGPALVDAPDTTVWVPHRHEVQVDAFGTLVVGRCHVH